jgi:hypothetical protein
VTATATIWRTCPVCGASFEQPDDPGRKRVYCSRACQQAAYRARQRQCQYGEQQRTGRQDQRQDWHQQRHRRAGSDWAGASQRQQWRQDSREQRRPPPGGANGQRSGATSSDELARIRRIIAALLRKAGATTFPREAAACRAKAEALRSKYGL